MHHIEMTDQDPASGSLYIQTYPFVTGEIGLPDAV